MVKRTLSIFLSLIFLIGFFKLPTFGLGENGTTVAAGYGTTFYITKDGSLWGFGDNEYGQIGNGTEKNDITVPVKVLDNVKSVASGEHNTFAVKKDGTLWGWGASRDSIGNKKSLTPIKLLDDVNMIATNEVSQIYVIKNDGTLLTRGNTTYLGDVELEARAKNDFVEIPNSGKVKFVVSSSNVFFINEQDELWGWGLNKNGSLGVGHENKVETPVKIMEDVQSVASDNSNTMIIRKDGSLWMCGHGNNGDFYDGEKIIESSTEAGFVNAPIKIMDNVIKASSRQFDFYVIKRDSTLWGWGDNRMRILNPDSSLDVDFPVRITSGVNDVACGSRHMVLAKTDNTLWTGGENFKGGILGVPIGKTTSYPLSQSATNLIDMPASWALAEVREAEFRKLVPPTMQNEYSKIVTRSEFCTLAIIMIEQANKMSIEQYLSNKGISMPNQNPFEDINGLSDTAKKDILAAYSLNIVNGTSMTTFSPTNPITREQAAKMLTATATALGKDTTANLPAFADQTKIASWAKPFIGYVVKVKVMNGVGENNFDPMGGYQRQQAYMTMLRLYKEITGE